MRDQTAEFEYAEAGSGAPVLLLPGSFGTGSGWRPVHERLGPGYRVVTTSLLGYGKTPEARPDGNSTMGQQVAVIDAIIDRIGAPTHVIGHSFGGLAALVHALTGRHRPASLVLVEANPLGLLRVMGDDERYEMFSRMTAQYFAAFAANEPEAARYVIDFYGGAGAFDALPAKVRAYVVATTAANVRDWSSGTPFAPTKETLASISVPTVVIRGERSHPAMLRIAERLAESIPDARLVTIEDGSHFLPSTHPDEIAALIDQHVGGCLSK
jgi:pimeloyl-ACP methyl ester carboxylesterase